jgi:hypothetical protein
LLCRVFVILGAAAALAACGDASSDTFDAEEVSTTVPGWTLEFDWVVDGAGGAGEDRLYQVMDLAEDPEGRIFVAAFGDQRVFVFDTLGSFVRTIGRPGRGPGEFTGPRSLVPVGADALFVLDLGRPPRLSRFRRSDGAYLSDVALQSRGGAPNLMHGFANGAVAIEFRSAPRMDGEARHSFVSFVDTLSGSMGERIALGTLTQRQSRSDEGGSRALVHVVDRPFSPRPVWTLDGSGRVLFGTGEEYAVFQGTDVTQDQVFAVDAPPVPVSDQDKAEYLDGVIARHLQATRDNTEFPDHHPFLRGLRVDPDGLVWVWVPSPHGRLWEVRSDDGALKGEIRFPRRMRLGGLSATAVYLIEVDENDLERIHRYRLVRG